MEFVINGMSFVMRLSSKSSAMTFILCTRSSSPTDIAASKALTESVDCSTLM